MPRPEGCVGLPSQVHNYTKFWLKKKIPRSAPSPVFWKLTTTLGCHSSGVSSGRVQGWALVECEQDVLLIEAALLLHKYCQFVFTDVTQVSLIWVALVIVIKISEVWLTSALIQTCKMPQIRQYFSELEKSLLTELVAKHEDVIESKRNDYKSIQQKSKAWVTLTEGFTGQAGVKKRESKQRRREKPTDCWW